MTMARRGAPLEGDDGFRVILSECVKMSIDLDFNEKPFFRSALWEATWKNHEGIVKALADKGASIEFKDYQERTPLHEAAFYGHVGLAEYFLEKGANIDVLDKFGQTPLFRAVDGGRHEVVDLLIRRRAQTNLLDKDEVTPQHCASFQGMPSMSHWLLYNGAWKNRFSIDSKEEQAPVSKGIVEEPPQEPPKDESVADKAMRLAREAAAAPAAAPGTSTSPAGEEDAAPSSPRSPS